MKKLGAEFVGTFWLYRAIALSRATGIEGNRSLLPLGEGLGMRARSVGLKLF